MNEQIVEILGQRYWIALAVVAILVLGNQALVQPYLMQLITDAPLINVAGRQRMLSQRLVKAALAFGGGRGDGAKAYLDEMRAGARYLVRLPGTTPSRRGGSIAGPAGTAGRCATGCRASSPTT